MFKQQKGITLIALVITIIVLLILAGVTIAMLSGNDSAPKKAQEAAADTKVAEAKEQAALDVVDKYTTFMAGKYQTNTITSATFTAYVQSLTGTDALGNGRTNYTIETSGTHANKIKITPKTSDNKIVRGTITNGGSIDWETPAAN